MNGSLTTTVLDDQIADYARPGLLGDALSYATPSNGERSALLVACANYFSRINGGLAAWDADCDGSAPVFAEVVCPDGGPSAVAQDFSRGK